MNIMSPSNMIHVLLLMLSICFLTQDLKIKMGQRTILNAYHPDADDFFNVNSNLRKLCATLVDPSKRLCEIEIQLFTPFK